MNTLKRPRDFDPFGCRAALAEALAQPELDLLDSKAVESDEVCMAAYEVALALGRCRLFGVDAGEDDGVLPVSWANSALKRLNVLLSEWHDDACELAARWNDAETFREADELCLELVEARMEAWAACVALSEALEDACVTGELRAAELSRKLDETMNHVDRLDEALQKETELLATAAETKLLENWRLSLAEPYRDMPPWWLDGTLEVAAEKVTEKARAVQPSREAWRKAWEAAQQGGQPVPPSPVPAIVSNFVEHEAVVPSTDRKHSHLEEQALSLDMAAEEKKAELQDQPKGAAGRRFKIGELDLDNIVYDVLTTEGCVFLRPCPNPPSTHLQVREKRYLLKRFPAHEDCEVAGLGRFEMEDFLDAKSQAPAQHTVALVSVDKGSE